MSSTDKENINSENLMETENSSSPKVFTIEGSVKLK